MKLSRTSTTSTQPILPHKCMHIDCENYSPHSLRDFSQILSEMRLLQYNSDGEFSLTKDFVGGEIPEYAILSHT